MAQGLLGGMFGAQQPGQAFQDPMQNMGLLGRLQYLQQNNPEALMALGSGMMQGNMGAGFAAAGDQMAQHREKLMEQQKASQQENMTKRWLMSNKGMSDEEAQMVMSNPVILAQALKGEERQSLMNAGDGQIYDPNTGGWISAPGGSQKPPQVVELFDEATGQPYKATWDAEGGQYKRVGGVKARSGMMLRTNPDGSVEFTEGDIGALPKLTEAEGRNSGFFGRGVKSHQVLTQLEGEGTSLWNRTMQAIPGGMGNYGLDPKAQKFVQAQRDFINAVLRRESGAVISPEEFENAKQQYFPQPGDSPEVIEQKRANRETTIRGLEISAGQGAPFATQAPTMGAPAQGGNVTGTGVQWSIEP